MFTINIYLRFALIAVTLIGGIVLSLIDSFGFWYALPFLLIGITLLAGYVLLGTVQSAAQLVQENRFDEAEKRLDLTFFPRFLYATNRAYYFMMKGTIAVARHDTEEGEMWLKKAQEVEVPTDNEKAMLELQLANIAASKGKWKQAKLHLREAKKAKITEPAVREQLQQFEKALQNQGQMKAAARMGMRGGMQPGKSKRRRPRMK